MKPLLIVKLGSTFPTLAQTYGDFEDWICAGLGVPADRVAVVDACQDPLPDPQAFAGAVLTGSHAMVTERLPWSEAAAQWTARAVMAETPLLGICYGHQLLAHALGGEVGPNPNGREFGTVDLAMHLAAGTDALLGTMPPKVRGHACHYQSVLRLPPGARCLASSARDGCQAFRVGRRAWGVQFHPEFDAHVLRIYIQECREALQAEGQSPEQLLEGVRETPDSAALLRRFAQLAEGAV